MLSRGFAPTLALAIAAASVVLARPVPQPQAVWLILVDDLHLQFKSTGHLRGLIRGIATDVIQEGDEFTVALSSGRTSLARTTERNRVDSLVRDISGMGLRAPEIVPTSNDVAYRNEVAYRENLTLQAATHMLDSIATDENRPRRLIVVSNGWSSGAEGPLVDTLTTRAKALAMPIVAIDPQQFVRSEPISPADPRLAAEIASTRASLQALAERSGGLAILDSGELAEVLALVRKALRLPGSPA